MFTGPLQSLVDEFGRLPGIGPKSAQRIAFHLLKVAPEDANRLAEAIVAVKERITLCPQCFNVAEGDLCAVCADPDATARRCVSSRTPATSWPWRRPRSSAVVTTSCTARSTPSRGSGRSNYG